MAVGMTHGDGERAPTGMAGSAETAALYRVFADAPLADPLDYCTACDTAEYERALHAPLASLPRALVDKYLADAIHHTGGPGDFAYFVPRILELEAEAPLSWFWIFAQRLEAAGFPTWSQHRQEAVCRALESIAVCGHRDVGWLAVLTHIPGIDWDAMFRRWPGADDPHSDDGEALEVAILCRSLDATGRHDDDAARVDAVFARFLDSPHGAAFADAHLARRRPPNEALAFTAGAPRSPRAAGGRPDRG
jgi:hypothetical protein